MTVLHRASHDLASQMKYGTGVNLILTKVLSIFVTEMRACSDISLIFADLISRIT